MQTLVPNGTVQRGNWVTGSGGTSNLHNQVNDINDATYAQGWDDNTVLIFSFPAPSQVPNQYTGHSFTIRCRRISGGDAPIALSYKFLELTTVIKSGTITFSNNSWKDETISLAEGEADDIGPAGYGNLRVSLECTGADATKSLLVSRVSIEVPYPDISYTPSPAVMRFFAGHGRESTPPSASMAFDVGAGAPSRARFSSVAKEETYVLEAHVFDPESNDYVDVRVASRDFSTAPEDVPQSEPYRAGMRVDNFGSSIYSTDVRLLSGNLESKIGAISLQVPIYSRDETPPLHNLTRYAWRGAKVYVYRIPKNGTFLERELHLAGVVDAVTAAYAELTLSLVSESVMLGERPLSEARHWGRPWGLSFTGSGSERVEYGDKCDLTGDFCIEVGMRHDGATGGWQVVLMKGTTSDSYSIWVSSDGTFWVEAKAGGVSVGIASDLIVEAGVFHLYTFDYSSADELIRIYVDSELKEEHAYSADPVDSTGGLYLGSYINGTSSILGALVTELRIWNISRSQDEISSTLYPAGLSSVDTGLILWNRFLEGTGSTLNDETATNADGTIYNAAWTPTYEGESDIAGIGKPWGLGLNNSAEARLIDSIKQIYQVDQRGFESDLAPEVYDGGGALTSDGGDTDLAAISSVASGHYYYDNSRGLIRLGATPASTLRIRYRSIGYDGGGSGMPEKGLKLVAVSCGGILEADYDVLGDDDFPVMKDVEVGFWTGDSTETRCGEVIQEMMISWNGWAGCDFDGTFRAREVTIESVGDTPAHDIPAADILLDSVSVVHAYLPAKTAEIGYRRRWAVYDDAEVLTSVTGADRADWLREYKKLFLRQAKDRYGNVLNNAQFGTSAQDAKVSTLLAERSGALLFAQRGLLPIHDGVRRVVQVPIVNIRYRPRVGDTVRVTMPLFGADAGKYYLCLGVSRKVPDDVCVVDLLEAETFV